MNLIIDIGNTHTKVAVFDRNNLSSKTVVPTPELLVTIETILTKQPSVTKAILCSVVRLEATLLEAIKVLIPLLVMDHRINYPFENLYRSPETLGLDRLALVAAAAHQFPQKNTLIIDAGSCITYDILGQGKYYHGGAISPGLNMRYKALNHFTSKLPYLSPKLPETTVGHDSCQSIHVGVNGGIIHEIKGVISSYQHDFQDLTVILTGGDIDFLLKQLKISIFANSNFLLEGLNFLLEYNTEQ